MYYKQRTTDSAQQPVDAKKKINKNKILKEKTGRRHNKSAHMHAYSITIHCVWVKCILYVGASSDVHRCNFHISAATHKSQARPLDHAPIHPTARPGHQASWTTENPTHRFLGSCKWSYPAVICGCRYDVGTENEDECKDIWLL